MKSTYDFFSRGRLPEDVWNPLGKSGAAITYRRGEFIYMQGQQPDCFYYLEQGRVRSLMTAENGDERQLTVYGRGDIFGEASFFDGLPRVSSAVALTNSTVVAIGQAALLDCVSRYPDLAVSLLHYLARTVRLLSEHVDSSFQRVPRRLAEYLVKLSRGQNVTIYISHEELGAAIGASRVSVSRWLNIFGSMGLVKTGYRAIEILNIDGLKEYDTNP